MEPSQTINFDPTTTDDEMLQSKLKITNNNPQMRLAYKVRTNDARMARA